jgi:hypothetical protein
VTEARKAGVSSHCHHEHPAVFISTHTNRAFLRTQRYGGSEASRQSATLSRPRCGVFLAGDTGHDFHTRRDLVVALAWQRTRLRHRKES